MGKPLRCDRHRQARGDRVLRILLVAALGLSRPIEARTLLDFEEELDRTRPEAWAMAWFGSLFVPTRLGEPEALAPGRWSAGLEAGWVPSLSEEERRVGFDGAKVEDLNRTSLVGRIRGSVGLPAGLVASGAWTPPLTIDGMEAHVASLGLGRSFTLGGRWALGVRGSLTGGAIEGDITCDRATVAAGSDPEANPFGCFEASRDSMRLRIATAELTLGRHGAGDRWRAYGGILASYFDNELQVRARYGSVVDRTRLTAEHVSPAVTLGVVRTASEGWFWAGEAFYAPLEVERPAGRRTDALLHVRLHLAYRFGSRP